MEKAVNELGAISSAYSVFCEMFNFTARTGKLRKKNYQTVYFHS